MARGAVQGLLASGLLLLLLLNGGVDGQRPDCPEICECGTWYQLARASCVGQHLYSIHTGVSSLVAALDLSNNSISKLEDRQLSRAGLTKLKYLNLSTNAINEIGMNAFADLKNLTILDLSLNHIDYIAPDTFFYNQNLRILRLGGNKFNRHVPKLHSTSLTELDLSGCKITHLPTDTFEGLEQLRKLDLSNNVMVELDKDVLRAMPHLRILSLKRNYWSCDESVYELRVYLHTRNLRVEPICEKTQAPLPPSVKLEKMIALKPPVERTEAPKSAAKERDLWDADTLREFEEMVQQQQEESSTESQSDSGGLLASAFGNVSPFWFLLIGFLLGSGATMVVTYLWLSTTISCLIPRIRRAEAADSADASSQRVSLLRHLWHQENGTGSEDSNSGVVVGSPTSVNGNSASPSSPSCPGTPPPPYREVMLHRNLYPRAAMAAAAQQPTAPRLLMADLNHV